MGQPAFLEGFNPILRRPSRASLRSDDLDGSERRSGEMGRLVPGTCRSSTAAWRQCDRLRGQVVVDLCRVCCHVEQTAKVSRITDILHIHRYYLSHSTAVLSSFCRELVFPPTSSDKNRQTQRLRKVSIVPRSSGALGFAQYLPQEMSLFSKEAEKTSGFMLMGCRKMGVFGCFWNVVVGGGGFFRKPWELDGPRAQQSGSLGAGPEST